MRLEIRLAGFGGQGIILAGLLLARAAALYDGKRAVQSQSYGAEARGGACKSEVVISDERIDYPLVIMPDALLAMSQQAFDKYAMDLKPNGILLADSDLVREGKLGSGIRFFKIPATKIAEGLGNRIVATMVALGALVGLTGAVSREAMEASVRDGAPRGTEGINLAALREGFEFSKGLRSA
ncbi:MAG: 2-oxoacid:acceptor oxidoreductase family protein [Candidatus Bathyarchaeia archaeon]